MLKRPRGHLALLATVLLSMGACGSTFDAWIVNPCDHDIEVETFEVSAEGMDSFEPTVTATLGPLDTRFLEGAFSDAAGFDWSVRVDGEYVFEVDGERWLHDTVVVPAEAC